MNEVPMSPAIIQWVNQYSIYSGYVISIAGIFGNAMNILIFTQLKLFRHNQSVFYLIIESISNFLYLLIPMSLTILTTIYGDDATGRSSVWCKLRYLWAQIFVLTTLSMLCFVSADQFFSTNYWFSLRQICTLKLARYLAFIFVCLSIVHSTVFSYFYDVQPTVGCTLWNSIWLQYSTSFYYPVLVGLLPITIASLFSLFAFRNVRRIVRRQIPIVRRRLDQQMTAMVLMRIIVFVCLASPYVIFRIYIINFPLRQNGSIEYAIGRLIQAIFFTLISLHYTVSFYVFIISSSRFRRQVKFVLLRKCWQRWKLCCGFRPNQIAPVNPETYNEVIELAENI